MRGRADSNDACSIDVVDDDVRIQKKIMDLLGCRPVYWRHTPISGLSFTECNSQQDLDLAYQYTKKYEDMMLLLDPPCVSMNTIVITKLERTEYWENIAPLKFQYRERHYQKIENLQDFGFESFLSGIGGYVGIFLGYSILQFPELIVYMPTIVSKIKGIVGQITKEL